MVDVPNSEDEELAVVVTVFPNSEFFVAALCAVSPDGAKILVLRFAGCSEPALALRPEKRPPPVEAGVPEDWPKSDMAKGRVRCGAQKVTVCLQKLIASRTFRRVRPRDLPGR